nr:MAG TPA: Exodeoxyribonuclease [Caudoviricetes sp.]
MARRLLKKRDKTLIVDADSLLYEAASVNESAFNFSEDNRAVVLDEEGARKSLDEAIEKLKDNTKCSKTQLYLTGATNFRYDILPTYKHNRKDLPKPQLLPMLKEYAVAKHGAKITTKIEADDACSIHLSSDPINNILAHIDKDLNQVEGEHYNWRKDLTYELSYVQGQRVFYTQVLTGDSTDGYSGCKGIGKVKAEEILDEYLKWQISLEDGKTIQKSLPCDDIWEAIISWYIKSYYKETEGNPDTYKAKALKEALTQARVARMLRVDEFKGGKPILWNYKPLNIDLKKAHLPQL